MSFNPFPFNIRNGSYSIDISISNTIKRTYRCYIITNDTHYSLNGNKTSVGLEEIKSAWLAKVNSIEILVYVKGR